MHAALDAESAKLDELWTELDDSSKAGAIIFPE